MNTKRWLLASVAVFVVIGVLEFLVHGVLLSGLYKQTASVWRPEAEMRQMMWIFWAGYLVFAPFFALIYVKGYEKGKPGLGQGFRYGLYVGAMLSVMSSFVWYVILPIPPVLAFYWFLATLVERSEERRVGIAWRVEWSREGGDGSGEEVVGGRGMGGGMVRR